MRKLILPLVLLIFFSPSKKIYCQTDWSWQNPIPQGNSLTGCYFPSELTGYACGYSNTIIKTTNAGDNWELLPASQIPYNEVAIRSVYFLNDNTGFVAGDFIMKTVNGGQNWQITGSSMGYLQSIFAVNENLVFAGGTNVVNNTGKLYRSTNGGQNWQTNLNNTDITSIFFLNESTGFAGGDQIRKTTDGGNNWVIVQEQVSYFMYNSFSFLNNDTGYAVNHTGLFLTTNGGDNWINIYTEPGSSYTLYNSVKFTSADTGYISNQGSYDGKLMKTVNGGSNWIYKTFSAAFTDLSFKSDENGIAVGNNGQIYKTTDAGENWTYKSSNIGLLNDLESIYFPDPNTGFILGDNFTFLKSTNSGDNWVIIDTSQTKKIFQISFLNGETGFGAAPGNILYKTTNGGENWNYISTAGISLYNIKFINELTGFAASSPSSYRTTNGGLNWSPQIPLNNTHFGEIVFCDSVTGYVTRKTQPYIQPYPTSELFKTTNSGASWVKVYTFAQDYIYGFDFGSTDTGCAVAQSKTFRTTNGGLNWSQVYGQGGNAIRFADSRNVYGIGYKSTNGGAGWVNTPIIGYNYHMRDLAFVNSDTGFIVGYFGRIIKTTNGAGVHVSVHNIGSEIPGSFSLSQNYPNPFNPSTKIKFDIPKGSLVKLKVYDILGREVAELVNEKLNAGVYEYEWNGVGLPSGVYFYRLEAGEFVETKRMVLVK